MAEYINPQWRLPNIKEGNNRGYSMAISASNNRVSTGYFLPSGTKPKSISYWFKNTDPNGWSTTGYSYTIHGGSLSLAGNGFGMGAIGSSFGSYLWFIGHSTGDYLIPASATGVMTTDVWYHIVVTYDNSRTNNLHFYLDGVKIDETNETLDTSSANDVKIGSSATGGGNSGGRFLEITDVCIFDRALSDGSVATGSSASGDVGALYNSGNPGNPMALASPPKAYYPLGNSAHMGANYLTPNSAIPGGYAMSSTQATSRFFTKIKPAGKSNITFSTWYRAAGSSSNAYIFYSGSYGTYYLKTNGAGGLWHAVMVASGSTGSSAYATFPFDYDDGNWHHYIFNFDGSHFKTYIDGVLIKKTAKTGVLSSWGSTNAALGSNHNTNSGASARGDYSNFVAYDSTLTDGGVAEGDVAGGEIAELYNGGSPVLSFDDFPQKSNIETWFRLDQTEIYSGSTWRLNDASSAYSSSLDFNPSSYIDTNFTLPNYSDYSYSFWIKNTGSISGSDQWILGNSSASVSGDTGFRGAVRINNSTKIRIFGGDDTNYYRKQYDFTAGNAQGNTNIFNGEWYNIVVTFTSGTIVFYVNGVAQTQEWNTNTPITGFAANNSYRIGQSGVNTGYLNHSLLSNFQIFNTELSGPDAETIYNNGKPLADMSSFSSLVSWWKLDNTTTGIEDSKGSNDGTNNGTTKVIGSVSTKNSTTWQITQSNLINQTGLLMFKSYSPYALNFDGNDYINCGNDSSLVPSSLTISLWFKTSGSASAIPRLINKSYGGSPYDSYFIRINNNVLNFKIGVSSASVQIAGATNVVDGNWHHVVGTYDGSQLKLYLDGNSEATPVSETRAIIENTTYNLTIGCELGAYGFSWPFTGDISNVSIFNSALTASQITEIYNEGRPSNLHNFSGTAPVAWWQLGSNSSWTSPAWTVLDEIGSNNGTSSSMMENAIVDGVGTSGNGVSVNMGSANNISGSSPSGEANSLSVNMTLANIAGGVN